VGLTDEELSNLIEDANVCDLNDRGFIKAIETKLKEKNAASSPTIPDALTRADGEGPEYTSGWNDCRAEMLKGMK
jgi:hypothetical protein